MKNLFIWIVLISTAALGVAVAQPNHENGYLAVKQNSHQQQALYEA
jgi:hypothetical protein